MKYLVIIKSQADGIPLRTYPVKENIYYSIDYTLSGIVLSHETIVETDEVEIQILFDNLKRDGVQKYDNIISEKERLLNFFDNGFVEKYEHIAKAEHHIISDDGHDRIRMNMTINFQVIKLG